MKAFILIEKANTIPNFSDVALEECSDCFSSDFNNQIATVYQFDDGSELIVYANGRAVAKAEKFICV